MNKSLLYRAALQGVFGERKQFVLKKFGSSISYLTVDLIRIWKSSNEHNFAENRDKYLAAENPPDACYYRKLDYHRMEKMVQFIERYVDSITPENEMKMEIYFNREPWR